MPNKNLQLKPHYELENRSQSDIFDILTLIVLIWHS